MSPRHRPWLFWLLLAAASTFFAEVVSGSEPFPFFTAWGLLVILPLYGLHTLVLAALAFRNGAPRFSTLFFAGMLFGLYEAYITKVLWLPPWEGPHLHILGIASLATVTLVLWWHPFMAFIFPLMLVEIFASGSNSIWSSLPERLRGWLSNRRAQTGIAVAAGLLQTADKPPLVSLLAGAGGLLVLWGLLAWWRRGAAAALPPGELLPRGRAWWALLGLLAAYYLALGFSLRMEAMPALPAHLPVWGLYALAGGLLWHSLRRPNPAAETAKPAPDKRRLLTLLVVYLGSTALGSFLPEDIKVLIFLLATVFGWVFGISMFLYSVREVFKRA